MNATKKNNTTRKDTKMTDGNPLYMKNLLEMKITLLPMEIGENQTKTNILRTIQKNIEGRCIREGYVRPKSINIRNYSSGLVKGEHIEFTVVFECYTCNPVEGTVLSNCIIKSVTKAGIHCNVMDEFDNIPVTVFVARDHQIADTVFQKYTDNDIGQTINVKVVGNRFELNDECVEVLGVLDK